MDMAHVHAMRLNANDSTQFRWCFLASLDSAMTTTLISVHRQANAGGRTVWLFSGVIPFGGMPK